MDKDSIRVYFEKLGGHYHLKVYVNGALSGKLIIRESEVDAKRRIRELADIIPAQLDN